MYIFCNFCWTKGHAWLTQGCSIPLNDFSTTYLWSLTYSWKSWSMFRENEAPLYYFYQFPLKWGKNNFISGAYLNLILLPIKSINLHMPGALTSHFLIRVYNNEIRICISNPTKSNKLSKLQYVKSFLN